MIEMKPKVFFFSALMCEVKPLIKKYQLKKQGQQHPFDIYCSREIAVIISGVGKISMAGAVAYALAVFSEIQSPVLINLGIAGHKKLPIGTLRMADKIVDAERPGKIFYPQIIGTYSIASMPLQTVVLPQTDYRNDGLFDMEAAAFYEIAVKFSSCELIHCLKVVSDNQEQPIQQINASKVSAWVDQHLLDLEMMVENLLSLREGAVEEPPPLFQVLIDTFHFTVSARLKLKVLLMRWDVLTDHQGLEIRLDDFENGKQIIQWLEDQIEQRPFYL